MGHIAGVVQTIMVLFTYLTNRHVAYRYTLCETEASYSKK